MTRTVFHLWLIIKRNTLDASVEVLDKALERGIPQGSWVVVAGEPGVGKSILCIHFAYAGLNGRSRRNLRRVVYVEATASQLTTCKRANRRNRRHGGIMNSTSALVPADWQTTETFFKYPIATKARDDKVETVKPTRRELSQSGLRGTWYFAFDDVDVLIYLRQSCYSVGRHRWVEMTWCGLAAELCDKIANAVSETRRNGGDVEDVVRVLKATRLETPPTADM